MKYNRYALTLICGILVSFFSSRALAQVAIVVDTPLCGTYSTTLHGTNLGSVPYGSGITIDDNYSSVVNIGFTFNFYGNNYTQLVIGSNGMLNFNTALAGAYCPWPISAALLGNSSVYNCVCGPWCDIDVAWGGTIEYSTVGTAPNRKFLVTYCKSAMFSCTTQTTTSQIILYETSNVAEVHIGSKTVCTWNGGYAIVGVQNAAGTVATAAPGRDFPSVWTATNEAWRFSPTGSPITNYTVAPITYAPVPYASSSITWYDSTTGAYLGTGPSLVIAPVIPTTYVGVTVGCYDSARTYIHIDPATLFVAAGDNIVSESFTNPTDCGKPDGTITLLGSITPGVLDTVWYTRNGVPQPPVLITSGPTDSAVHITGLLAGTYTNIHYHGAGHCPSNAVGPVTLVDPTLSANFTYTVHQGCVTDDVSIVNGSSTTITSGGGTTTIFPPNYTSVFTYGDGNSDSSNINAAHYNPTHSYPISAPGTYNITLQYHNAYGCSAVATLPVTLGHPISSVFTPSAPSVCLGVPEVFTNTSVGGGAHYLWTFGDGSTATDMNPSHVYAAAGTYNIQLLVTDSIPCTAVSNATIDVVGVTTRTSFHDTIVCLRMPLPLNAYTEVIPASYTTVTYQWTPGANLTDPTIPNPDFMAVGDFVYTFTATVQPLGCTASDVMTIHSNPPIILTNVTVDQTIPIGGSVQLNADSAWVFVWSPNNGTLNNPNINNPIATPTDSVTTYMVVGMSPYGCRDSATVTIRVDPTVTEFIPEAFTPNGDGLNDVFRVYNLYYQKLVDFRIYNRWGHEVFHTIDPKKGWDGTFNGVPQDMGTYFYQVIVAHPDGQQKAINGSVTLIR